jgi:hypothetical protein
MIHDRSNWRMKTRCAALALIATALPLAYLDGSAVRAQSIMRSPNIHIDSRIPTINPAITPRINPNIAGTVVTRVDRISPNLRTRRLQLRLSRQRRRMPGSAGLNIRWRRQRWGVGQSQEQRAATQYRADSP